MRRVGWMCVALTWVTAGFVFVSYSFTDGQNRAKAISPPRKFALIVSGSNEEFFRIVVNDLHDRFRGAGLPRERVTILENQNITNRNNWYTIRGNATKKSVFDEIAHLARIAAFDDTVIIHFSDHGDPAGLKQVERSLDGGRNYTRLCLLAAVFRVGSRELSARGTWSRSRAPGMTNGRICTARNQFPVFSIMRF